MALSSAKDGCIVTRVDDLEAVGSVLVLGDLYSSKEQKRMGCFEKCNDSGLNAHRPQLPSIIEKMRQEHLGSMMLHSPSHVILVAIKHSLFRKNP